MTTQTTPSFDGMTDPKLVLESAAEDASAGDLARALSKYEWFHANALRVDPSFHGVRLSFAIAEWHQLALRYPPAMESLQSCRDAAEAEMCSTPDWFSFQDVMALNARLDTRERTVALFKWLHEHRPDVARRAYRVAQRDLVTFQEFELCGKYLDASDVDIHLKSHDATAQIAEDEEDQTKLELLEFAENMLAYEAGLLVALLVHLDRGDEASKAAQRYFQASTSPIVAGAISAGLQGEFPAPYP